MSEDDKKKQLSLEFESEPEKSEPNEPTEIVDGEVLGLGSADSLGLSHLGGSGTLFFRTIIYSSE